LLLGVNQNSFIYSLLRYNGQKGYELCEKYCFLIKIYLFFGAKTAWQDKKTLH